MLLRLRSLSSQVDVVRHRLVTRQQLVRHNLGTQLRQLRRAQQRWLGWRSGGTLRSYAASIARRPIALWRWWRVGTRAMVWWPPLVGGAAGCTSPSRPLWLLGGIRLLLVARANPIPLMLGCHTVTLGPRNCASHMRRNLLRRQWRVAVVRLWCRFGVGNGGRAHDGAGGTRGTAPRQSPRGTTLRRLAAPSSCHGNHLGVPGVVRSHPLFLHVVDCSLEHMDVIRRVALHVSFGGMWSSWLLRSRTLRLGSRRGRHHLLARRHKRRRTTPAEIRKRGGLWGIR